MTQAIIFLVFSMVVLVAGLIKPRATRIFVGIFFLVMALGVNGSLLFTAPESYVQMGSDALLPVYRWFFTVVMAAAPAPFVVALILYETTAGLLILARGKWVRVGLIMAAVFCVGVSGVGLSAVTSPVFGLAIALLLRHRYDQSLIDLIAKRPGSRPSPAV